MDPLLRKRRSLRAFARTELSKEEIESFFEAARWAPSCFNSQPWRFVATTKGPAREALDGALSRGNAWAKAAPLLIAAGARRQDGVVTDGREYYLHDLGLAVENLLLEAASRGWMAHPMAGFDAGVARAAVGGPRDWIIEALIAVGHPGDPSSLDERTRAKDESPNERKSIDEVFQRDRYDFPEEARVGK